VTIDANSRFTLGDFELTIISDGTYWLDGGALFGVVPKVLWQKRVSADEKNRVAVGMNSLLIRDGKHTVLVETGAGNKLPEKLQAIYGTQAKLLENMQRTGVSPDEIDVVINTHLHFDHCGWNTVQQGNQITATFPRARYYVQHGEWNHASLRHERDAVSYISDNYDPLIRSGQMELLHGDQEIVPGISVKVFPGHTRHLQAVIIKSKDQHACYVGDLVPTSAHVDLTWVMAFDLFPLETIESRKRLYEHAIPEKWLMIFTHDPQMPWAYLQRNEHGRITAEPAGVMVST
jgi:glyoxylase-like metal-dependent hydrolase (beta-lactamase superfamily II)